MPIQVYLVSDLHTDHKHNRRIVEQLKPTDNDSNNSIPSTPIYRILLVAGDISASFRLITWTLTTLRHSGHWNRIFFVTGNNEMRLFEDDQQVYLDSHHKKQAIIHWCKENGIDTEPALITIPNESETAAHKQTNGEKLNDQEPNDGNGDVSSSPSSAVLIVPVDGWYTPLFAGKIEYGNQLHCTEENTTNRDNDEKKQNDDNENDNYSGSDEDTKELSPATVEPISLDSSSSSSDRLTSWLARFQVDYHHHNPKCERFLSKLSLDYQRHWLDFRTCQWNSFLCESKHQPSDAAYWDEAAALIAHRQQLEHRKWIESHWTELDALHRNGTPIRVVSFSHFLPSLEIPWRFLLGSSTFSYLAGDRRIFHAAKNWGSEVHAFGHSHSDFDQVLDGIRIVQHSLKHPTQQPSKSQYQYQPKLIFSTDQPPSHLEAKSSRLQCVIN